MMDAMDQVLIDATSNSPRTRLSIEKIERIPELHYAVCEAWSARTGQLGPMEDSIAPTLLGAMEMPKSREIAKQDA